MKKYLKNTAGGYSFANPTVTETLSAVNTILYDDIIGNLINFKGEYSIVDNVPFLSDATGMQGDYYQLVDDGTRNFGSGPVSGTVGDYINFKDGKWTVISSTSTASWGSITGNIANQTDLQTALGGKMNTLPSAIQNDIAIFDASGQVQDSGTKLVPSYTQNITPTSWTLNGAVYQITILASVHEQGTFPMARIWAMDAVANVVPVEVGQYFNTSGDITLTVSSVPDGRYLDPSNMVTNLFQYTIGGGLNTAPSLVDGGII